MTPSVKEAKTSVPILEAIANRWSPRAFADKAVPKEVLRQVFEAARWAPSSFNDQPWRYIIGIKGEGTGHEKALAGLNEWNQKWAHTAPVLGFSISKTIADKTGKPNRYYLHDVGASTTLLAVQAAALGLQIHQMGGIDAEVVREQFNVPEGYEVVAGFALGYPGALERIDEYYHKSEQAERTRKPLAELVFTAEGGFGQSWG